MAERPPLDLGDILGQYEVFGGTPKNPTVDHGKEWWEQVPGAIEREIERERRQYVLDNNPQVMGYGPLTASTCMDLVPQPLVCWDVLGYYRTLGVHWKATKKELMVAYQAFGSMPTAYQTHVFKQLLNPAIRRAYDATPLGELFMHDQYVQQWLKNKAAKEASRRSKEGRPTTAKEVIEEQFRLVPEDTKEMVDTTDSDGAVSDMPVHVPFAYAWFTWRSKMEDTDILAEWQSLVIKAVAEQGEVLNVAVGFVGKQPHRYLVGRVGPTQVAFLNEKECPTPGLASAAALALINDMKPSALQKHHR